MKTCPTSSQLVHFGENCLNFKTDSLSMREALATHFKHCSVDTGHVIAQYEITAITETHVSVTADGSVLFPNIPVEQALWQLMQAGLTRLNGECISGPIFHAAALEQAGHGIILCGQSGSGKSSLAAWLVATGLRYLTDEVITYSADNGQISGFARSLVLKRGSAFIWQHWLGGTELGGFFRFADGSAWIEPGLFNSDGICRQAPPRLLIFPHYAPRASFRAEKLTQAEALFQLLQTLVNARNLPKAGLEAAASLTHQVTAYSLEYSDIESACAWIQRA